MAYTLTQARGLLTAAELNLFDHSRAAPIKALTPARLRGKITRARALRDKYRDLYRRQTVATRSAPARQRAPAGGDNDRTQRKAELFAEVLTRFEARLPVLDAQIERAAAASSKKNATAAAKAAPARGTQSKSVKLNVKAAVKAAVGRGAAQAAPAAPQRSAKAPARSASREGGGKVNAQPTAPLDVEPAAQRRNPLKQRADHVAQHAHAGSQVRRAQGQRDSR